MLSGRDAVGNPLATAAGLDVLDASRTGVYERLEARGAALEAAFAAAQVPAAINRVGSMLTPFFAAAPVTDYASATSSDTGRYGTFARALLARGVYPPPSQFEAWFVSAAHSDADLARTGAALAEAAQAAAA